MKNSFMEAVMNPIRTRIIQFLMVHETGTVNEMKKELFDIPSASFYRHIKVLLDAHCIVVKEQRQIRGTIERVYQLNSNPLNDMPDSSIEDMIQSGLYTMMNSFHRYFADKEKNPQKDMVCFRTSTLLLSDEEFMDFFQSLGNLIQDAMKKEPKEGRKQRSMTIISLPGDKVK